jgi:hypothetical protein
VKNLFDAGARRTAAGGGCAPHFELIPFCVNIKDRAVFDRSKLIDCKK